MKARLLIVSRAMASCLAPEVQAQVPAVPAVPAAAPASGGCFAGICACLSGCKLSCCSSPFGQLISSIFKPVSIMTGGVIPTPCASNAANMLAAAAGQPGPAGAAAAIQAEEANAKARRAAVRYLGTVDCHYFPEAEASLIAALRADQNECVRWEAAHQLGTGCCCNKRTIEALTITVQGSDKDGNPSEDSPRVRAEAFNSLQHCLEKTDVQPVRPELPPAETPVVLAPQSPPLAAAISEARQTVEAVRAQLQPAQQASRDRSILGAWARAKDPAPPPLGRIEVPTTPLPEPHLASAQPVETPSVSTDRLWTPQQFGELTPMQPAEPGVEFATRPSEPLFIR